VKVNCAALPAELLESELFGHERGAFTGAATTRIGKFEQADGGTLMLDEIGEMKPALQAKLLHVLQDAEFTKLGSNKRITVDVRVVAATNRDLEKMMLSGDFREDLYYRLKVIELTVPALRERREEIATLTDFFVARYSRKYNRPARPISDGLRQLFAQYDWPGNIRELENVLQRAIILSSGTAMALGDAWMPATQVTEPLGPVTLVDVERHHIRSILEATRWRIEGVGGAAQMLGLRPSTLRSRMLKLGISRPR
jgi:transcriptional regulator with GAF, ATPase, and Fis domain